MLNTSSVIFRRRARTPPPQKKKVVIVSVMFSAGCSNEDVILSATVVIRTVVFHPVYRSVVQSDPFPLHVRVETMHKTNLIHEKLLRGCHGIPY